MSVTRRETEKSVSALYGAFGSAPFRVVKQISLRPVTSPTVGPTVFSCPKPSSISWKDSGPRFFVLRACQFVLNFF